MLDARPVHITDFRHQNRDGTDVIMAKIREKSKRSCVAGHLPTAGDLPTVGAGRTEAGCGPVT